MDDTYHLSAHIFCTVVNDATISLYEKSRRLAITYQTVLKYGQYLGLPLPPPGSHTSVEYVDGLPMVAHIASLANHTDESKIQTKIVKGPKRRAIDWQERDKQMYPKVIEAVDVLLSIDERPKKIKLITICRNIGVGSVFVFQNKHRLPYTIKLMRDSVDTNETFALRTIQWLIQEYREKKIAMSKSSYIRKFFGGNHMKLPEYIIMSIDETFENIR